MPDPELHTPVVLVLLPRTGSTAATSIVAASSRQARVPRGHADSCAIILISPCLVVWEEQQGGRGPVHDGQRPRSCRAVVARCSTPWPRCVGDGSGDQLCDVIMTEVYERGPQRMKYL